MRKHLAALLVVLLLAILAGSPALGAEKVMAEEVKVGDSVAAFSLYESFPSGGTIRLVSVMNPEGIGQYKFQALCDLQAYGTVTVVAKDQESKRFLVKYESQETNSNGFCCPSGTLFFVSEEDFAQAFKRVRNIEAEQEAERQRVKKLLGE